MKAPEPGVYPGVPMELYHDWDAASSSRLSLLRKSAAHLKAALDAGTRTTDALAFGKAAHMAILEPELFAVRYAAKSQCRAITGKDEQCRNQGSVLLKSGVVVCRTHLREPEEIDDAVELLTADDHAACLAMRANVLGKRRAAGLFTPDGESELSVVWDDPETGVRCKARIDHYEKRLAGGTLVDVKTTRDASASKFERAVWDYGYHRQAAFYMEGARQSGLPAAHYCILPIEKTPPYECGVFRMTEGAIDAGNEQNRALLKLYARCRETDEWPGYPDEVRDIALPPWAWSDIDEELSELEEVGL